MTPRIATAEDIPALIEMGRKFHAMSPHKSMAEFDPEAFAATLRTLMADAAHSVVLTNGTGLIAGMMTPIYFNPSVYMMEELLWWAEGGGKELLAAFTAVSKAMGARHLYLSTLEDERVGKMDEWVKSLGFSALERRYIKDLQA